jgi:hypothetical protein
MAKEQRLLSINKALYFPLTESCLNSQFVSGFSFSVTCYSETAFKQKAKYSHLNQTGAASHLWE